MANEFNVGRDATLNIIDPAQGPKRFKIRTGYDVQALYNDLMSKGLDGITRRDVVPDGWRLNFTFDRGDSQIDDYFAEREAVYFNGGNIPKLTITETIKEVGGRISQFRYTDITMKPANMGTWRGDAITTQSIEATASRRIKIA